MDSLVAGTGICLPTARNLAELYTCISLGRPLEGTPRPFSAPYTDLEPLVTPVGVCPDLPAGTRSGVGGGERCDGLKTRSRRLPREARLATGAAADALAALAGRVGDRVGTVWVSSTAGMAEYGQLCVDAATLEPGLASPLTGPQSAYNGPAAAVSIQFGLTGPQVTLTGGAEAGAAAVVEAGRMLGSGECDRVLVGGSASVSRWRLAGAEPASVPAEGAICLLLGGSGSGTVAVRPLYRARIHPAELPLFVARARGTMSRLPDAVALATPPGWRADVERALAGKGAPRWSVERSVGDLGAAAGLQAVLAAVAGCGWPAAGLTSVLVLAAGGTSRAGDAVAVEVLSTKES